MPVIARIITFMSTINLIFSCVEHEKIYNLVKNSTRQLVIMSEI